MCATTKSAPTIKKCLGWIFGTSRAKKSLERKTIVTIVADRQTDMTITRIAMLVSVQEPPRVPNNHTKTVTNGISRAVALCTVHAYRVKTMAHHVRLERNSANAANSIA